MTNPTDLTTTTTPMHLTVDPWWQLIEVLAYGQPCDLIGADRYVTVVDDHVALVLDETLEHAIGFVCRQYDEFDPIAADEPDLWDGPRFCVPVLGLLAATVGEILLVVRTRFAPGEPTADAMHFHAAMDAPDAEAALPEWQLALEAGDMKAHYALGYTLCELERFGDAWIHLRFYVELVPNNAWAWCWLGQACVGLQDTDGARAAFERTIELDDDGDTDAAELLAALDG